MNPADYEAWYHTRRGAWVSDTEFALMRRVLMPQAGERLLDVGCGTGHFTRRFAQLGLQVTGIDPDPAMLEYAKSQNQDIDYQLGSAEALIFADASFDHVAAITSLCFIEQPAVAIKEMWRVCQRSLLLGLLNRHSLLYQQKFNRGGYRGARWDTKSIVNAWLTDIYPSPQKIVLRTGIFLIGDHQLARLVERCVPSRIPFGAFLLVKLTKVI